MTSGVLRTDAGREIALSEIASIYYRRPEPSKYDAYENMSEESRWFSGRESSAALLGFLRLANAFWMNHPDITHPAEAKLPQLRVAGECGLSIPRTLVTNVPDEALAFIESVPGKTLVKTVHSPQVSKSHSAIAYSHMLQDSDMDHLDALTVAPCIFQEYVEKAVECRVVVVDSKAFSVDIFSQDHPDARVDWRKAAYNEVHHAAGVLPTSVAQACIRYVKRYGLNFAAIDLIRRPTGDYVFLECNPNGEWAWLQSLTGIPIAREIARVLSANLQVPTSDLAPAGTDSL